MQIIISIMTSIWDSCEAWAEIAKGHHQKHHLLSSTEAIGLMYHFQGWGKLWLTSHTRQSALFGAPKVLSHARIGVEKVKFFTQISVVNFYFTVLRWDKGTERDSTSLGLGICDGH